MPSEQSGNGTVQASLFGDRAESDEPETSEDYKFSRPQCIALTNAGDRCSNPTVRGVDTEFCPRHEGMEVSTIND